MTELTHEFWESRFRERRTPWERGEIHPAFTAWRASGELTPCRILVPGAGRSPEPEAMLRQGFDVVALDLAESAGADQASRLGINRAVRADVTTWMPDKQFDAVYDQTCLCALPPELWVAYDAAAAEAPSTARRPAPPRATRAASPRRRSTSGTTCRETAPAGRIPMPECRVHSSR